MTNKLRVLLTKKLTPILAFVLLWMIVVLDGVDWNHFDERMAIFLLVPVFCIFVFLAVKEVLSHREEVARIGAKNQTCARINTKFNDSSRNPSCAYIGGGKDGKKVQLLGELYARADGSKTFSDDSKEGREMLQEIFQFRCTHISFTICVRLSPHGTHNQN